MPAVTVVTADAQEADLLAETGSDPFDRIVSRFGVMFFSDPAAALANLRRACVQGARIAFASWHHSAENIFRHGLRRVAATLPAGTLPPALAESDSPTPVDCLRHESGHLATRRPGIRAQRKSPGLRFLEDRDFS